ncbi:hypothetical protein CCB80_05125 [Armatimonadetes bacterium Uphvl-Ar1]|nr:hypothetical protein CCB80_05125 [Armatimonadetes bacterium Uphvl-Ar1]
MWSFSEGVGFAVPVVGFSLMSEGDVFAIDPRDLDRKTFRGNFAIELESEGRCEFGVVKQVGFGLRVDGENGESMGVGCELSAVMEPVVVNPIEGEIPVENLVRDLVSEISGAALKLGNFLSCWLVGGSLADAIVTAKARGRRANARMDVIYP